MRVKVQNRSLVVVLSHRNINLHMLLPLRLNESDNQEFLFPLFDLNQVRSEDIYSPDQIQGVKLSIRINVNIVFHRTN